MIKVVALWEIPTLVCHNRWTIWPNFVTAKLLDNLCLQLARVTTKDIWEIDEVLQVLSTEVETIKGGHGVI